MQNLRFIIKIIKSIINNWLTFVMLLFVILFVELLVLNRNFLLTANSLPSKELEINQGSMSGFILDEKQLISNNDDPKIFFQEINLPIASFSLKCQDDVPGSSQSQMFFRGSGQEYSEIRSINFALEVNEPVYLPETTDISELRFDPVGQSNIAITCETILLNPKIPFAFSSIRVLGYLLVIVLFVLWFAYIPASAQGRTSELLFKYGHWLLCVILFITGLVFEVTITYDSAHFLWLTDLIRSGDWASWDVIRNPAFPLQLYIAQSLFGNSINSVRVAMVICLVLFYLLISMLGIEALQLKVPRHRFLLRVAVFWFIAIDPIVFGYFHCLLTEFDAAILIVASSWLALKLYREQFLTKRFWILVACNILLMLAAWFLKQPYLSTAIFPFFISLALILINEFSWKKLLYFLAIGTISIVMVLGGQLLWTKFLISKGNPISKERQFSTWLGSTLETQQKEIQKTDFVRFVVKKYLISINLFPYLWTNELKLYDPSFIRGNENVAIAQRTYQLGLTNQIMLLNFSGTIRYPSEHNNQPAWLNAIFQSRIVGSNMLFVVSGLLLPFVIVYEVVIWIRKKSLYSTALLIILGSSSLNALTHSISGAAPIDRYFFLGFPLHLLVILLVVGKILLPKQQIHD